MLVRTSTFYFIMFLFLFLLGGIQQETGLLPPEIGLAQLAPGIAGLLMLAIFRKDSLRITFRSKKAPAFRYLVAALIPIGLGVIILFVQKVIGFSVAPSPNSGNLLLILLWAPLGALGEEIGWRGYLHKNLDTKMKGLFSSLLVGLLWMPMHVHFLTQGLVFILAFLLFTLSASIIVYALVQDAEFSVLLATIFHLSINLTNLLFLDVIYENTFMLINGVVWAIAAAALVLWKKNIYFHLVDKEIA